MPGQVIYSTPAEAQRIVDSVQDSPVTPVNPYIMGETMYGSEDALNPVAPDPDLSVARTDTWDINNQPLDISDNPTDGVEVSLIRVYPLATSNGGTINSNDATTWEETQMSIFTRPVKFDMSGRLTYIGVESLCGITFLSTHINK